MGKINGEKFLELLLNIDSSNGRLALKKSIDDHIIHLETNFTNNNKAKVENYNYLLQIAIKHGDRDIIAYMIDKFPLVRDEEYLNLYLKNMKVAIQSGNKRILNLMINIGINKIKTEDYIDLFKYCIQLDKYEIFKLLKNRIPLCLNNNTVIELLQMALLSNTSIFIEYIQDIIKTARIDITVSSNYNECLKAAYDNRYFEAIDYLAIEKIYNTWLPNLHKLDIPMEIECEIRYILNHIDKGLKGYFNQQKIEEFHRKLRYKRLIYTLNTLVNDCKRFSLAKNTEKEILEIDLNSTDENYLQSKIHKLELIHKFFIFRNSMEIDSNDVIDVANLSKVDREYFLGLKDIRGYTLLMTSIKARNIPKIKKLLPYCSQTDVSNSLMIVVNIALNKKQPKTLLSIFWYRNSDIEKEVIDILTLMRDKLTLEDIDRATKKINESDNQGLKTKILNILCPTPLISMIDQQNQNKSVNSNAENIYIELHKDIPVDDETLNKLRQSVKVDKYHDFKIIIDNTFNKLREEQYIDIIKICAEYGRTVFLQIILDRTPNIVKNNQIISILQIASERSCLDFVDVLVRANNKLVEETQKYLECCNLAVLKNDGELLELLIKQFKINRIDYFNEYVNVSEWLDYAVKNGYKQIIEVIIEQKPEVVNSDNYISYIDTACKTDNLEIHKLLCLKRYYGKFSEIIDYITNYGLSEKELMDIKLEKIEESKEYMKYDIDTILRYDDLREELQHIREINNECLEELYGLSIKYEKIEEYLNSLKDGEMKYLLSLKTEFGKTILDLAIIYKEFNIIAKFIPFCDSHALTYICKTFIKYPSKSAESILEKLVNKLDISDIKQAIIELSQLKDFNLKLSKSRLILLLNQYKKLDERKSSLCDTIINEIQAVDKDWTNSPVAKKIINEFQDKENKRVAPESPRREVFHSTF